jgi:hypothetical protein
VDAKPAQPEDQRSRGSLEPTVAKLDGTIDDPKMCTQPTPVGVGAEGGGESGGEPAGSEDPAGSDDAPASE